MLSESRLAAARQIERNGLFPKENVLQYLTLGERASKASPGLVHQNRLSRLLLEAGYVSLAIGSWLGYSTTAKLEERQKWLVDTGGSLHMVVEKEDVVGKKYHLREGLYEIETVSDLFQRSEPDSDINSKRMRIQILSDFLVLDELKKRLEEAGKTFRVLGNHWKYSIENNTAVFYLSPVDLNKYKAGFYTLEQLEEWLEHDTGAVTRRAI